MKSNLPPTSTEKMFWGISGAIVKGIAPHTESDPVAILSQLLTAFGNCVGRSPYISVEADRHGTNLFVLNIGNSSKGRKGTSYGYVRKLFEIADSEWLLKNVKTGLSSGEGLLWALRDSDNLTEIIPDVADKRLLCVESEFASLLKVMSREGNTLSPIIRAAWDGGNLQTLTKRDPIKVSEPHISIIGHITRQELISLMRSVEISNGFGNRFLYFCIKRSQSLPFGGAYDPIEMNMMGQEIKASLIHSRKQFQTRLSEDAKLRWQAEYESLSRDRYGLAGVLTSRAEPQVLRLALCLSLLNREREISDDALKSALSIFEYSEKSVNFLYGVQTGNKLADKILEFLDGEPSGASRKQITDFLARNFPKESVQPALDLLEESSLAQCFHKKGVTRPTEIWISHKNLENNEQYELSGELVRLIRGQKE